MNFLGLGVCLVLSTVTQIYAEIFELNGRECGISPDPWLIINGTEASPGQFPWMVHLLMFVTRYPTAPFACGGTMITRRHVLTAAHCFVIPGQIMLRVEALYGHNDVRKAKRVDVARRLVHKGYSRNPSKNDIAIALVKKRFEFSETAKPACLPPGRVNVVGRVAVVAGWGYTVPGGGAPDHLRYTTVTVLPDAQCKAVYTNNYTARSMLCAYNLRSGTCGGDSGGPLFIKGKNNRFVQVGIVSYGAGCRGNHPKVLTQVDYFMRWIKKNIGKHQAYEDISPYVPPIDPDVSLLEPYSFSSLETPYLPEEPYFPW